MRSTHVANLSQQNCPEQFFEDVCAAALVFFQYKVKYTVNNLLRRNLEKRQYINANFHLCQQQPNFSPFLRYLKIWIVIGITPTLFHIPSE